MASCRAPIPSEGTSQIGAVSSGKLSIEMKPAGIRSLTSNIICKPERMSREGQTIPRNWLIGGLGLAFLRSYPPGCRFQRLIPRKDLCAVFSSRPECGPRGGWWAISDNWSRCICSAAIIFGTFFRHGPPASSPWTGTPYVELAAPEITSA